MLQLLVEMELLTECRESDFVENWGKSKSQLKPNIKRLLAAKNTTTTYEIPGKCYHRKSMHHY